MTTRIQQPREWDTGRFGFDGRNERLCVCGHALRWHLYAAPHKCNIQDADVEGPTPMTLADGFCKSDCKRFRPLVLTAPQVRVLHALADARDPAAGVRSRELPIRPGSVRAVLRRLAALGLLTTRVERRPDWPAVSGVVHATITDGGRVFLTTITPAPDADRGQPTQRKDTTRR